MNGWFDEYFNNHTGRNRFFASGIYNPSTGELHLHVLLGLLSAFFAIANYMYYVARQEAFVSVMLGILVIGVGIAGLIMSCKNLPYAVSCKSIYRVGATFTGILCSLFGILGTVGLYLSIFLPRDIILSFFS